MQFGTLSVLGHGHQVEASFQALLNAFQHDQFEGWRLPAWLRVHAPVFLARLLPREALQLYQRYHDCGKPFCRAEDGEGRAHFPDHARLSEQAWLRAGGHPAVGRLIGLDMAFHLCPADAIPALALLPEAASLYLTAIAEVHANAAMFGGPDSASFKAKLKHLDRRGRALLRCWGLEPATSG